MTRLTPQELRTRKGRLPLVALTAYSARMAQLLDPHVDILLVGDSVGMVIYGMRTPHAVTLEMMIAHGKAVAGASSRALVVVDIPAGTYETSQEQALSTCARVLRETGCGAVKLEGGTALAPTLSYLVQQGIPVIGHIGLMPQQVLDGNYAFRGRTEEECRLIKEDAHAIETTGASALVLEAVTEELANSISHAVSIPVIGIGASAACDGQVLVSDDMLGMFEKTPRFVKQYDSLAAHISAAASAYAAEVRGGHFPSADYTYPARKNPHGK